jgi:hypothetical protein
MSNKIFDFVLGAGAALVAILLLCLLVKVVLLMWLGG